MSKRQLISLAVLLAVGGAARASDPVGIYAVIERVVLEPSADPERIQVSGVFALAKGRGGDDYADPVRGIMSFTLVKGKEDVCRKEWADLKKMAGTKQCVAFASRYKPQGTVRKGDDTTKAADVYPLGLGLTKIPPSSGMAQKLLPLAKLPADPKEKGRDKEGKESRP